jgi:CrcB protein
VTRLHLAVGCGAGIGALLRFVTGLAVAAAGLPAVAATGLVNLAGSFVIGAFVTLSGPGGRLEVGPAARQFVTAGFCGGLTTFSALSVETLLLAASAPAAAALSLGLTLLLSLGAVWAGHALAQLLNHRLNR